MTRAYVCMKISEYPPPPPPTPWARSPVRNTSVHIVLIKGYIKTIVKSLGLGEGIRIGNHDHQIEQTITK